MNIAVLLSRRSNQLTHSKFVKLVVLKSYDKTLPGRVAGNFFMIL